MTFLELALLAVTLLVGFGTAYFFVTGRRASAKAKEQAKQSQSQTRDDIRKAARARELAENGRDAALRAKESAEAEARLANERAAQADARAKQAKDAQKDAEIKRDLAIQERDAAIAAKTKAENEFRLTLAQVQDDLRLANARAKQAEAAQKDAEKERDVAIQERNAALDAKAKAERDTQIAIGRATQAENERDAALEQARQVNEQMQIAQDAQKRTELERDEAIQKQGEAEKRAHLAEEAQSKAERERGEAIEAKEQAEKDRDIAIQVQRAAEASALIAIQKQIEAEERAQLAREAQRKAESERDEAFKARDEAVKEKENAKEATSVANESAAIIENNYKAAVAAKAHAERQKELARARSKELEAKLSERREKLRAITRKKPHSPPINRGPRRGDETEPIQRLARLRQPQIVCYAKSFEWLVGIQLPKEFLNDPDNVQVDQEQSPLDSINDLWELRKINSKVSVRLGETILWNKEIQPQGEKYLLFKLSGYDLRRGTRVRALHRGAYLVVVPENWERENDSIGSAAEAVSLEGYSAHYYVVDQSTRITFRSADKESITLPHDTAEFELIGNRLPDANQDYAILFGAMLPHIRAKNAMDWKQVKTIIVGEEGRGRKDWKSIEVYPHANNTEQALPPEIAQWQASWFFVRLYDHSDQLIDSMDFRLARGLSAVKINQASPFPPENGHAATMIEFHHKADCTITCCEDIKTLHSDGITLAEIPAEAQCDETHWTIAAQGDEHEPIEITVRVERIWWAVGTVNQEPANLEWTSKPLEFTRADFDATSNKEVWLRLPSPRWTGEVSVGFAEKNAKRFNIKVAQQTFPIQLYSFADDPSLQQIHQARLNTWVNNLIGTIAQVSVRAKCRFCDKFIANSEEEILTHLISPEHSDTIFQYQDNLTVGLMICKHSACQFSGKVHWIVESRPHDLAICKHAECIYRSHSADSDEKANIIKYHVRKKFEENRRQRNVPAPFDRKCHLCKWEKRDPSEDDLRNHLKQTHAKPTYASELFELC